MVFGKQLLDKGLKCIKYFLLCNKAREKQKHLLLYKRMR